jgi:hypothetical protein
MSFFFLSLQSFSLAEYFSDINSFALAFETYRPDSSGICVTQGGGYQNQFYSQDIGSW